MNDLILFFAILGFVGSVVWLGVGIGAAARHLVQLHADRVAAKAKPVHCSRCEAYTREHAKEARS